MRKICRTILATGLMACMMMPAVNVMATDDIVGNWQADEAGVGFAKISASLNAYVNGSVSVYRKGGVMKQTEKESTEENEKTDEKALIAGLADDADDEDSKSTDKAVEVKEGNVVGDWLKKIVQLLLRCS